MRAGIVMWSTIGKYKRLDATFYLSDTTEIDAAILRTKKAIRDDKARLARLQAEKAAGRRFKGGLIESGELVMIETRKKDQKCRKKN